MVNTLLVWNLFDLKKKPAEKMALMARVHDVSDREEILDFKYFAPGDGLCNIIRNLNKHS